MEVKKVQTWSIAKPSFLKIGGLYILGWFKLKPPLVDFEYLSESLLNIDYFRLNISPIFRRLLVPMSNIVIFSYSLVLYLILLLCFSFFI